MIRVKNEKARLLAQDLLYRMWGSLAVQTEGITYENHALFDGLAPVLAEAFVFPTNWFHREVIEHVARAVIETKSAATEDFDAFLSHLNQRATALLNARAVKYEMWTKLSLHGWGKRSAYLYRVGNVNVVLKKQVPKSLKLSEFFLNGMGRIHPDLPKNRIVSIARGNFRSDSQAGNGLNQAISDLTAIINFAYQSVRTEWRSGKARPKAKLLTADNQYLFKGGKSLNTETIWYNPDFREDFWSASNFRITDLENADTYVKKLLRQIKDRPSGSRVLSAIRMMGEGAFSHDLQLRILRTWTAFEVLLSRSAERADRYEDIIRRATFIAKDKKRWEMQLLHSALTRNRYVHENATAVGAEAVADTLDAYLTALIDWILFSKFEFETHERLLDTLDLTVDVTKLGMQVTDRERAIEILSS